MIQNRTRISDCLLLSDKGSFHHYDFIYDLIISNLYLTKKRKLNVLEIGVRRGNSMMAFSSMDEIDTYVGVDIDISLLKVEVPQNAKIFCKDAYDKQTIDDLQSEGPFDIIIDDGSHTEPDMWFFFQEYTQLCCQPAYLIFEDVRRFWKSLPGLRDEKVTLVDCSLNRYREENDRYIRKGYYDLLHSVLGIKSF